jgi:hypothetical protein
MQVTSYTYYQQSFRNYFFSIDSYILFVIFANSNIIILTLTNDKVTFLKEMHKEGKRTIDDINICKLILSNLKGGIAKLVLQLLPEAHFRPSTTKTPLSSWKCHNGLVFVLEMMWRHVVIQLSVLVS